MSLAGPNNAIVCGDIIFIELVKQLGILRKHSLG